jgi:hypothetical protein
VICIQVFVCDEYLRFCLWGMLVFVSVHIMCTSLVYIAWLDLQII